MKNIPNDKLEDYYTDTLLKLNTKQYPGLTKDKFMKEKLFKIDYQKKLQELK